MESNRKDCAATFALLLPVKVKLKVEATRSHKSKKETKPQFLRAKWAPIHAKRVFCWGSWCKAVTG